MELSGEFVAPIRAKLQADKRSLMMTFFWDDQGILISDVLGKGLSIDAEYYSALVQQLPAAIREKRRKKKFKELRLLQDNARVHTAKVTMAKLQNLGLQIVEHPPYSPDLAPSDYYLFKNLKIFLQGKHYTTKEDVVSAVNSFFDEKPNEFFKIGLDRLKDRWRRCIDSEGEYLE